MVKHIYLKMDIAGYHIFIHLPVNQIKIISSNVDNFILIFFPYAKIAA